MAKHFYALHFAERPHTVPSTPNLNVWYAVKYLLPKLQHFGFGPVNITQAVLRECIFSLDEVFKKDGRAIKFEIFGFADMSYGIAPSLMPTDTPSRFIASRMNSRCWDRRHLRFVRSETQTHNIIFHRCTTRESSKRLQMSSRISPSAHRIGFARSILCSIFVRQLFV